MVQGNFPTTSNIHQQPMERLNVMGERRMNDMGTNTSDVVVQPTRNGQECQVWRQMLKPPYELLMYYCLLVVGIM